MTTLSIGRHFIAGYESIRLGRGRGSGHGPTAKIASDNAAAPQGWNGVLRTGIVGGIYTLVVAITDSLWSAIVLHALLDLAGGIMAWLALRRVSHTRCGCKCLTL